jgi:hypothetical protein
MQFQLTYLNLVFHPFSLMKLVSAHKCCPIRELDRLIRDVCQHCNHKLPDVGFNLGFIVSPDNQHTNTELHFAFHVDCRALSKLCRSPSQLTVFCKTKVITKSYYGDHSFILHTVPNCGLCRQHSLGTPCLQLQGPS